MTKRESWHVIYRMGDEYPHIIYTQPPYWKFRLTAPLAPKDCEAMANTLAHMLNEAWGQA